MMQKHSDRTAALKKLFLFIFLGVLCCGLSAKGGEVIQSPWHVSVMGGRLDFEGNQAVKDTFAPSVFVGYDLTNSWTLEGYLLYVPNLEESFRTDWDTGKKISRLEENAGVHETSTIRLGAGGLYHFAQGKTVDPYLSAGIGAIWYEDNFNNQYDAEIEAGGGLIVNLSSQWALRLDGRSFFVGTAGEFNSIVSLGLMWTPTKPAPAEMAVATVAAVPPEKLDTDGDGLADAVETSTYHTDPMNADSDWDGLSDGTETMTTHTDPLKRDTDGGGVADGHEVIEDKTNPQNIADDLEFYALHIEFPKGSAEIMAQYYGDLDVIGKTLNDQSVATLRIEGHIDKRSDSSEKQALKLTEKRAESVLNYLAGDKWKISRKRMVAVGYGFSRPQEKPDIANGNLANRRIEIYIRHPAGSEKK